MLACIAFSCPNLEFMEILKSDTAMNRITGYDAYSSVSFFTLFLESLVYLIEYQINKLMKLFRAI